VFVGIARIVLKIPEARSLKDRRQVIRSFKERLRSRLRVAVAEVGDVERHQIATIGVVTVTRENHTCEQILGEVRRMAETLPSAALTDIRGEVLSMGESGKELRGGIEGFLGSQPSWYVTERSERE
jgi:uncharacterized protein